MNLEPGPEFNVFSGDNGQGKTNLLEALYAVCTLRSFRTSRLADLISIGRTEGKIAARLHRDELDRIYELELRERGRTARIDGKVIRPISRYFGQFNVVLFAPEDLAVVRGSPGNRRKFLDRSVFNWSPEYLPLSQDYDKVLRSRNQLLRDLQSGKTSWQRGEGLLEVYDQQLARSGAQVMAQRVLFLEQLREHVMMGFESIMKSGLELGLDYACKDELRAALEFPVEQRFTALEEALGSLLRSRWSLDRARGTTSIGPHRDDLLFTLSRQPAATFASQGQTRAMVLAWKTALLTLLQRTREESPVLLLDDVSSELDPRRNQYLFAFLSDLGAQSFITTTHPDFVLIDSKRADWSVKEGRITPLG